MLGIDVSKRTLACALVDPATRHATWQTTVPNTPDGIARLLASAPPSCPWVLEPTGPYSRPVVAAARAAGRQVLAAPPRAAQAFLAALSPRAKSDRLDSFGLARYALAVELRPYPVREATVERLAQLLAARKGVSQARTRLRQQRDALPLAADALAPAIAALEEHLATLDRQVMACTPQLDSDLVARLDAVPGIGPITAATVAVCLTSKAFSHPDQFVAYAGLDVRVRESGQWRGKRRLTRQGDAELRRLLFLAAQANLRVRDPDNPFKRQYARERAKGLASTAALCAVARKLARTCWSLAQHGTTYDPARVQRQPTVAAARQVSLANQP
jgi:transposase